MAKRISQSIKDQLIRQAMERRIQRIEGDSSAKPPRTGQPQESDISPKFYEFDHQPGFQQVQLMRQGALKLGVKSPFFRVHEGVASAHTHIGDRELVNFASYNYLHLAGDPRVNEAAKAAIDDYGTSVSASRIVAGERPFHLALERALADLYGVDDALSFVSGHATNVSVIGHLLGPRDLVLHDEYAHNSILMGCKLAGVQRMPFPHNDLQALERQLKERRQSAERVLIVVEGIYSMDGDYPDLPRLIELKRQSNAWLMVDEAHSLGVLGASGRGLAEHFGIEPREVDIWMGTLSKTFASCGGFVAGDRALIDNLRFLAPGFLYSVGLAPPVAAAALAAIDVMQVEPWRIKALHANGQAFLEQARYLGLDTGTSSGYAVIPWIVGSSVQAVRFCTLLLNLGVNVQPILYPAVPEKRARLRFFMNAAHGADDLRHTFDAIEQTLKAR